MSQGPSPDRFDPTRAAQVISRLVDSRGSGGAGPGSEGGSHPPRRPPGPLSAFGLYIAALWLAVALQVLSPIGGLLGIVVLELVAIGGLTLVFTRLSGHPWPEVLAWRPPSTGLVVVASLASLPVILTLNELQSLLDRVFRPPDELAELFHELMSFRTSADWVIGLLAIAIIPGILEELMFRGFIQTAIARRASASVAILIPALLFATMHMNPWWFLALFGVGVWLGWLRQATDSVIVAAVVHAENNALAAFQEHGLLAHVFGDMGRFDPWRLMLCAGLSAVAVLWILRLPDRPRPRYDEEIAGR